MGRAEEQEFAEPLTISRSVTLSDTAVGQAGSEVQADPEPSDLGTLHHAALVLLSE